MNLNSIKIKSKSILIWGCTHFNHNKEFLWGKRGFNNVQEHNQSLIRNWNSKATEDTVGILLGDSMFGYGGADKFEEFLNQLKCSKWFLMPGNHHAGFKQLMKNCHADCFDPNVDTYYNFVPNIQNFILNHTQVVASHFPLLSWENMGKGAIHLYSHVHGSLYQSEIGTMFKRSKLKQYEVSVEENPFPIEMSELLSIMSTKEGEQVDHHNDKTTSGF